MRLFQREMMARGRDGEARRGGSSQHQLVGRAPISAGPGSAANLKSGKSGRSTMIQPENGWIYPESGWIYPENGWIYPENGWIYPENGWMYHSLLYVYQRVNHVKHFAILYRYLILQ